MAYSPAGWKEPHFPDRSRDPNIWTEEELELLRMACAERWHIEALRAKIPRRTENAIGRKMWDYGLRGLRWNKNPTHYDRGNNYVWTDEMLARIKHMRLQEKLSCQEVGSRLGFTKNAIIGAIDRHIPELKHLRKRVAFKTQQE